MPFPTIFSGTWKCRQHADDTIFSVVYSPAWAPRLDLAGRQAEYRAAGLRGWPSFSVTSVGGCLATPRTPDLDAKKIHGDRRLILHFPQDRTPRHKAARVQRIVAALAAAKDISGGARALATRNRRDSLDAK